MIDRARQYWLSQVSKLLGRNGRYQEFDLNSCMGDLERNPANREAALAIFWSVYLGSDDRFRLDQAQLDRIKRLMQPLTGTTSEDSGGELQARAFVTLCLAGTVLASELGPESPSFDETPTAVKAMDLGRTVLPLNEPIDIDITPTWGKECLSRNLYDFSQALVTGIIGVESSYRFYDQAEYGEAFLAMANHCGFLYLTSIQAEAQITEIQGQSRYVEHAPAFTPYLPHSQAEFDLQELADFFNEVRIHKRSVKDWRSIADACSLLQYFGEEKLYDQWNSWVETKEEGRMTAPEFFAAAKTFAEQHISPSELTQFLEEKERIDARGRLKRDFFDGGLWEVFEDDTRNMSE